MFCVTLQSFFLSSWPSVYLSVYTRLYFPNILSVYLFPCISIASLVWTICSCFLEVRDEQLSGPVDVQRRGGRIRESWSKRKHFFSDSDPAPGFDNFRYKKMSLHNVDIIEFAETIFNLQRKLRSKIYIHTIITKRYKIYHMHNSLPLNFWMILSIKQIFPNLELIKAFEK